MCCNVGCLIIKPPLFFWWVSIPIVNSWYPMAGYYTPSGQGQNISFLAIITLN